MQFVLNGFTQDMGFRVFAFEGIAEDRVRTEFTVRADVALVRRHGIPLQELPLVCRSLLEKLDEGAENHTLTFTEDAMRVYVNDCAAKREAAAQKRKPARKPVTENVGAAWRVPQPW